MVKETNRNAVGNEPQSFGNPAMRFLIAMAAMPGLVTCFVFPIRDKPDLVGRIAWAQDFHPHETGRIFNAVWSLLKCLLDLFSQVSNGEAAECHKTGCIPTGNVVA